MDEPGPGLEVVREVDAGTTTVRVGLPAVVTCDLRLNIPRYPKVRAIMASRRAPIETVSLEDLELPADLLSQRALELVEVEPPKVREPGTMVADVPALVARLEQLGAL